jgi:hypothetical protein
MKALVGGLIAAIAVATSGCATDSPTPGTIKIALDPYQSTYVRYPGAPTLIRGATVYDGDGGRIERGEVLIRDGAIAAVGQNLAAADAVVVDGTGKFVTPGIIDVHSHLGD